MRTVEAGLRSVDDYDGGRLAGTFSQVSSSVMINRDEVLEVLTEAIDRLPDELRQARWLLKEREDFLKRVQAEGDEILDAASAKAEAMVQRTEVVKAAEQRARRIVEAAEDEARRLRMECEDFCDQRLAQFEIVLNRTLRMVHAGRDKLSGTPMTAPGDDPEVTGDVPTVRPDSVPAGGFGRPQGCRRRGGLSPSVRQSVLPPERSAYIWAASLTARPSWTTARTAWIMAVGSWRWKMLRPMSTPAAP